MTESNQWGRFSGNLDSLYIRVVLVDRSVVGLLQRWANSDVTQAFDHAQVPETKI